MSDNEDEYSLVMPFVVCASQGGPFDDDSFVAGFTAGTIDSTLRALNIAAQVRWYVPSPLVPQMELIAMHRGWQMVSEPWEEYPDDWTLVTFAKEL
jgi:hypothetical protein